MSAFEDRLLALAGMAQALAQVRQEFFEHDLEFSPDAWWRIDSDIDAATGGYVNQTGLLHDPNGRPVALSRQLFAVFG